MVVWAMPTMTAGRCAEVLTHHPPGYPGSLDHSTLAPPSNISPSYSPAKPPMSSTLHGWTSRPRRKGCRRSRASWPR